MTRILLAVSCLILLNAACNQPLPLASPAGYDLASPEIFKLPPVLDEISGIAFNIGNPDTVYAQQDEDGRLFFFAPGESTVQQFKFGKNGDYEDIAIMHQRAFLLRSDGAISSFLLELDNGKGSEKALTLPSLLPKGEYEGMWADEDTRRLFVLCKVCADDRKEGHTSGYILQWSTSNEFRLAETFRISNDDIARLLGKKKINFQPSAIAKNLNDGQWYLLSSVNKLLVVADASWVVKAVYPLSPALFAQPEGMAFDRNNHLYISNERGEANQATLLKFSFKNKP